MNTQDNTHNEIEMTYDMPEMPHDEMGMTYDNGAITCDNQPETVRRHIKPLIEQGRLAMTLPEAPKSKNQKYITIK